MRLPPEILQKIVREATVVPEAFDTSFDSVLQEDREAVVKAIQTSMFTKTSVSLVSTFSLSSRRILVRDRFSLSVQIRTSI
jgi:hypothetical protein